MAQVAATAGMSVGHIYRYFANKEAVIAAIVEQGVAEKSEHIAAIRTAMEEGGRDLAEVSSALSAEAEPFSTDQDRALLLEILAEAARNPAVARIVQQADARLRGQAEAMVAAVRPAWSVQRVAAAVEMITVLHEGLYLRSIASPGELSSESVKLRAALISFALQQ